MADFVLVEARSAEVTRRWLDGAGLLDLSRKARGAPCGSVALPLSREGVVKLVASGRTLADVLAEAPASVRLQDDADGGAASSAQGADDSGQAAGLGAHGRDRRPAALYELLARVLRCAGASEATVALLYEVDVPRKWEKLGDVALLAPVGLAAADAPLLAALDSRQQTALWAAVMDWIGAERLAVQGRIEPSLHRKSMARMVYWRGASSITGGNHTDGTTTGGATTGGGITGGSNSGGGGGAPSGWTLHRENGVIFGLDVRA